jgi:hypothetical protein
MLLLGPGCEPMIIIARAEIARAIKAIGDGDVVVQLRALESLKGYKE